MHPVLFGIAYWMLAYVVCVYIVCGCGCGWPCRFGCLVQGERRHAFTVTMPCVPEQISKCWVRAQALAVQIAASRSGKGRQCAPLSPGAMLLHQPVLAFVLHLP